MITITFTFIASFTLMPGIKIYHNCFDWRNLNEFQSYSDFRTLFSSKHKYTYLITLADLTLPELKFSTFEDLHNFL